MSERFSFHETSIPGLLVIERVKYRDNRGYFSRFFCSDEFLDIGYDKPIVQMNHTLTTLKGAVRGMHFQQPPYSEVKVVTCLKGKVFDVAVDLRKGSSTFLHWHAEHLSGNNMNSLFIPEGFAHGFQALTENCELLYLHSEKYKPEAEGGVNPLDPKTKIDWPLDITDMSEKDRKRPFLDSTFNGIIAT